MADENGLSSKKKAKKEAYVPKVGDKVFAQVKGHPFWPARVEEILKNKNDVPTGKYTVFFYGTYETAPVNAKQMEKYEDTKEKHSKRKNLKFQLALREIEETPDITCAAVTPDEEEEAPVFPPGLTSETISQTVQSDSPPPDDTDPIPEQQSSEPEALPDGGNNAAGATTEEPAARKRPKKRSAPKDAEKSASKKSKKRRLDDSVPKSSKKARKEEPEKGEPVAAAPSNDPVREGNTSGDNPAEREKLAKLTAKAEEKKRQKEKMKAQKLEQKRQERLKQKAKPLTEETIREIDQEIIESLSIDADPLDGVPRALRAMTRLDSLPVTPLLLCNYQNILITIRKCRKYVHDGHVRNKAEYLHHKYKNLFSDPSIDPELLKKIKGLRMNKSPPETSNSQPGAEQSEGTALPETTAASAATVQSETSAPVLSSEDSLPDGLSSTKENIVPDPAPEADPTASCGDVQTDGAIAADTSTPVPSNEKVVDNKAVDQNPAAETSESSLIETKPEDCNEATPAAATSEPEPAPDHNVDPLQDTPQPETAHPAESLPSL